MELQKISGGFWEDFHLVKMAFLEYTVKQKVGDCMSKKEKLISRLKRNPKDFTFDEMRNLLELLGFEMSNKGKTSGSRVKFKKGNISVYLHKPHRKELLECQTKDILQILERGNLL